MFYSLLSAERSRFEKIASGYHDDDVCKDYCRGYKRHYGRSFVCQFNGKEKIKKLLLKNPNVPLKARTDPLSHYTDKPFGVETENYYKLIQVTEEVHLWWTYNFALTCSILTHKDCDNIVC